MIIMKSRIKNCFWAAALLFSQAGFAQGQLTLEEARKLALLNNKKLKQASYEIEAARAFEVGTHAINKPVIDGSVAAFHVGKPLSNLLPGVGVSPSLTVTQPIYAGGKIRLGQAAAAKGVQIYQDQKRLSETEVLYQVDKAYWQIVSLKEKIKLANQARELLDSLAEDLNNAFDAGMIYKNDLLRVQVQRNETDLNIAKANDGLVLSKLALAQIIGADAGGINVADSVSGSFHALLSDSVQNAADQRIEIQILKKALEAQELQRKMLQADFKPTLGVLAGGFAGFGKRMNMETGGNSMASYFAMLSLNIPIWDWGVKASKVKEQSFKITAHRTMLEETKELLSLEIQNAYLQLNQAARKIVLSDASVEQAEENLRLSNDRFKAGTVTGQDVLEAQMLWQQANSSVIDAKIEYRIAEAAYRKAIGENGSDMP
jgi:outer membrane protein